MGNLNSVPEGFSYTEKGIPRFREGNTTYHGDNAIMADCSPQCSKEGCTHKYMPWATMRGTPIHQTMCTYNYCFSCAFWHGHAMRYIRAPANRTQSLDVIKKSLVIDGKHYHVGKEPDDGDYRAVLGHGGAKFIIYVPHMNEVFVTHNLWHQGTIPEIWRRNMPDNAKFLPHDAIRVLYRDANDVMQKADNTWKHLNWVGNGKVYFVRIRKDDETELRYEILATTHDAVWAHQIR